MWQILLKWIKCSHYINFYLYYLCEGVRARTYSLTLQKWRAAHPWRNIRALIFRLLKRHILYFFFFDDRFPSPFRGGPLPRRLNRSNLSARLSFHTDVYWFPPNASSSVTGYQESMTSPIKGLFACFLPPVPTARGRCEGFIVLPSHPGTLFPSSKLVSFKNWRTSRTLPRLLLVPKKKHALKRTWRPVFKEEHPVRDSTLSPAIMVFQISGLHETILPV